jgi:hypothetical protein
VTFDTNAGTFTIVGDVTGLVADMTLLWATGPAVVSGGSDVISLKLREPDAKNSVLLTALGIPVTTKWLLMYATFQTAPGSNGVVSSVDIQNVSVPDGGVTLMLLGGALVGLETLRRRLRV